MIGGESKRVIFAETLGPVDKASNELAIVEIDADANEAFFGDPWRLSEDIRRTLLGGRQCRQPNSIPQPEHFDSVICGPLLSTILLPHGPS